MTPSSADPIYSVPNFLEGSSRFSARLPTRDCRGWPAGTQIRKELRNGTSAHFHGQTSLTLTSTNKQATQENLCKEHESNQKTGWNRNRTGTGNRNRRNRFPVLPFLGFSVLPRKNLKLTKDFCPPPNPLKPWENQRKRTNNQGNSLLIKLKPRTSEKPRKRRTGFCRNRTRSSL